ncbi:retropepsin-like aspartic protease family protein [Sphingomonas psychrotolerans]|uniref:TIGR02281 family clan AA aspartic protease n=1 Tax=Sphingomonas psychrotolerans TaxID=1327635 RepID=A0A2K8ML89_9SPHN|nr:TIGR02281 family clan AA aspartic protease [Sphingomonas psychrotolerans]ATY33774.1 TIGR02281 family clan AA aspartic protease [Sphingomonas psychrotolerans]
MRWAFLSVVAIGVVIGVMAPVKRAPAPAPVVALAEAAPADVPVETVIKSDNRGHFFAFAQVEGETVKFLVDTGADMVALTLDDARRAKVKFDPERFDVVARGASGDVYGQRVVIDDIVLDGKRVRDVHAAVVEDLDVSLLGQSYLRKLRSVHLAGDEMRLR